MAAKCAQLITELYSSPVEALKSFSWERARSQWVWRTEGLMITLAPVVDTEPGTDTLRLRGALPKVVWDDESATLLRVTTQASVRKRTGLTAVERIHAHMLVDDIHGLAIEFARFGIVLLNGVPVFFGALTEGLRVHPTDGTSSYELDPRTLPERIYVGKTGREFTSAVVFEATLDAASGATGLVDRAISAGLTWLQRWTVMPTATTPEVLARYSDVTNVAFEYCLRQAS